MRVTRLHLVLGLAVVTGGALAACGSTDGEQSHFPGPDATAPNGNGDGGADGGDGSVCLVCGDDGGGNGNVDISNIASIAFNPTSWSVTSDGVTPQSKNFTLTATLKDGTSESFDADLLADTVFSFTRPDLGTLTAGNPSVITVHGTVSGSGVLQAVLGNTLTATATVSVTVNVTQTNGTISAAAQTALDGVVPSGSSGTLPDGGSPGDTSGTSDDGGNDGGFGTPIFTTNDPSLKSILYPYDKTVFPLGIDSPLLMWTTPAPATDVYKVHIAEVGFSYDYYTAASGTVSPDAGAGNGDIQFPLPQAIWDEATASNQGDPMVVTIARYDGSKAYVSVVETWPVAHESLRGSIYYWALSGKDAPTGSGDGHLARIHPGTGDAAEYIAGGQCIGCHAVSSDGTTLVGSAEGFPATGTVAAGTGSDVASYIDYDTRSWATYTNTSADAGALPTKAFQSDQFGGNLAVSNTGKYVVFGAQELHLATTADGQIVANSNIEKLSYTNDTTNGWMDPAFSPDGTKLAAIKGSTVSMEYGGNPNFYVNDYYENLTGGGIQVVDFANAAFSNQRQLVAQGPLPGAVGATNTYLSYPSFAPDSATLAFQAGDAPDGCHYVDTLPDGGAGPADCGPTTVEKGAVYLTKDGSTTAVRLSALSDPPATADQNVTFEPTFNPNARGGYFWVVVSSSRAWGNYKFPQSANGGDTNINKRLWVAAIDETTGAVDPSHPAFFLQSQEKNYAGDATTASINMRAFWSLSSCTASATQTTSVDGGAGAAACGSGFECCSGFCEQGTCVDTGSVSCQPVGATCTTSADCCGSGASGSVTCTGTEVKTCEPSSIR